MSVNQGGTECGINMQWKIIAKGWNIDTCCPVDEPWKQAKWMKLYRMAVYYILYKEHSY